jgi:peptidoglycan hydrolase-like protein with peptidoglycan-binding domain
MAGYYRGAVDGHIGPMTRNAIGRYQTSHRLPVTQRIDESLLQSLRLL